jgi:mono/diheme cytochrome c family protein
MRVLKPIAVLILLAAWAAPLCADEKSDFFEARIRPLLAKNCFECHGDKKQESDVRLDRKQFVMGKTSPLVAPGKPDSSRMWQVVKYDESDVQMPPKGRLSDEELGMLRHWIEQGAYWPDEPEAPAVHAANGIPKNADGSMNFVEAANRHWAYRPIQNFPVPKTSDKNCRTPVDQFLAEKLAKSKLTFSALAPRDMLIRRAADV